MALETEVKIRLDSAEQGRELLLRCGLQPSGPREFETNQLYDTAGLRLRLAGQLIRIRKVGNRQILTYKGKSTSACYKVREELETTVADADVLVQILSRLGYDPKLGYEKYRTEYATGRLGTHVLLDETPIGDFLELEGDGEWIDGMADRLGFSATDYITESYGALFTSFCSRHELDLSSMTFGAPGLREKDLSPLQ